jgi:hypothetical protein
MFYSAFDVLILSGRDLRGETLNTRRQLPRTKVLKRLSSKGFLCAVHERTAGFSVSNRTRSLPSQVKRFVIPAVSICVLLFPYRAAAGQ